MHGKIGDYELASGGCVTTDASIRGFSARETEARLGFSPGHLSGGFCVYALIGHVDLDDFRWLDRTRFEGGWRIDWESGESVQRDDQMRFHFFRKSGFNAPAAEALFTAYMRKHAAQLNIRVGPNRIVKVWPIRHVKARAGKEYFNSQSLDIPQWTLRREMSFRRIACIAPGERYVFTTQPESL